jgi:single-stranded DNA-binding protein
MLFDYPVVGSTSNSRYFDSGKSPVCRVSLTGERFIPGRNGEPGKNVPYYVTLVAFGKTAEMLSKVPDGTQVWAAGTPEAGKPYQKKDSGEWVSQLEVKVNRWGYQKLANGGGRRSQDERSQDDTMAGASVGASGSAAYGDDPFQDEF